MSLPPPVYQIHLDFPVRPAPRYGWGKPPHFQLSRILDRNREAYRARLEMFLAYREVMTRIPKHPTASQPNQPAWINGSLPGLDAATLYGFIATAKPSRYIEVGIGNSTRFARRAIQDHNLPTRIIAIDPYPMAGLEAICDQLIPEPLEALDLALFGELAAGDILFIDNSHRVFMNSDATVVFLDILPRLKPGVIVECHDIALPYDYPPHWAEKFYAEQYLLAAYLLAEGKRFEILLPNAFISLDAELSEILDPLWLDPRLNAGSRKGIDERVNRVAATPSLATELVETHGSSFWLRMN